MKKNSNTYQGTSIWSRHKKIVTSILIVTFVIIFIISAFWYRKYSKDKILQANLGIGLTPIRIEQVIDGKTQEVNFTDATLQLIAEALKETSTNPDTEFETIFASGFQKLNIQSIIFPPIVTKELTIIPKSETSSETIEQYLKDVYTIFNRHKVIQNLPFLISEIQKNNADTVIREKNNNEKLYYALFEVAVPEEALDLHTKYIKITQVQNHLLTSMLNLSSDPLRLDIDLRMSSYLLSQLKDPINQDLKKIQEIYPNIQYQNTL